MLDTVLNLVTTLPSDALIVYAWTRMLPVRNTRLLWIAFVSYFSTMALLRFGDYQWLQLISIPLYYLALPVLMSEKGALARKLLVVALALVGVVVVEIVCTLCLTTLTGQSASQSFSVTFACILRIMHAELIQMVCLPLVYLVYPVAISKGPVMRRLLAVALVFVCCVMSEIVCTTVWVSTTGLPISEFYAITEHALAYVFVRMVSFLFLVFLTVVVRILLDRTMCREAERGLLYFSGFVLIQSILLVVTWLIIEYAPVSADTVFAGGAVFCAVSLVADAYLLLSIDRYAKQERDGQRTKFLQFQLNWCLDRYRSVVDEIEHASQLRHDLRNQVQVATMLVERGLNARAVEHVDAMIAEVTRGVEARDFGDISREKSEMLVECGAEGRMR